VWGKVYYARSTVEGYSGKEMIKKVLMIPLRILQFVLFSLAVVCLMILGLCEYFSKKDGKEPIVYSKDGRAVDLDEYQREQNESLH
jgi:hypothetical protein